jgi:hypothetical protein
MGEKMNKCPNCNKKCIPFWRAFIMPAIAPTFECPCCQAKVCRKTGPGDYVVLIPPLVLFVYLFLGDHHLAENKVWMLGFAAFVLSNVAWLPFIRYRIPPTELQPM